jgi:hypothetical protein
MFNENKLSYSKCEQPVWAGHSCLFIHVIRDQHGLDEGKLALTKRFWFQKKAARKLLRAAFATLDRFVTAARGQAKRWFLGAIYA